MKAPAAGSSNVPAAGYCGHLSDDALPQAESGGAYALQVTDIESFLLVVIICS